MHAGMLFCDSAVALFCLWVAVVDDDPDWILVHVLDHTIEYIEFEPRHFNAFWAAPPLRETRGILRAAALRQPDDAAAPKSFPTRGILST